MRSLRWLGLAVFDTNLEKSKARQKQDKRNQKHPKPLGVVVQFG